MLTRWASIATWTLAAWVLITWTMSVEQIAFGVGVAAVVATFAAPLGDVPRPWRALYPRRLARLAVLAGYCGARIISANLVLARRIWSPPWKPLPIRPGMLVIPTRTSSEGGVTATGLLTSLIVDNQFVDLDSGRRELQYHAIWVDTTNPDRARQRISARIEDLGAPLEAAAR